MAAWCCCDRLCASRSAGWLSSPAGRQQERSDTRLGVGLGAMQDCTWNKRKQPQENCGTFSFSCL